MCKYNNSAREYALNMLMKRKGGMSKRVPSAAADDRKKYIIHASAMLL